MITDRELFVQMLERDIINLYESLSQQQALLNLPMVKQTIFTYADKGIAYATDLLFGKDGKSDIDEASQIAKFITDNKIEEYREKIRNEKNNLI